MCDTDRIVLDKLSRELRMPVIAIHIGSASMCGSCSNKAGSEVPRLLGRCGTFDHSCFNQNF